MAAVKKRKAPWRGLLSAALMALLGFGLVFEGAAVGEGVRRGLLICGEVLIPALFPFMALCCWLNRTEAAGLISRPLTPVTRHIFRLPGELGATALLSVIGGYPTGAKMISILLKQKRINKDTAKRMLCFCYGGSPSFLISAVGAGMLGSRRLGAALYLTQAAATFLTGAVFSLRAPRIRDKSYALKKSEGVSGLVEAVRDASGAMLNMCAWAVLFSGIISLAAASGLKGAIVALIPIRPEYSGALLAGLLEVTGGSLLACASGGRGALALVAIICSFGGLSIIFQVVSSFDERISFGPFILSRFFHAGISAGLFLWAASFFEEAALPAMAGGGAPIALTVNRPWFAWACLLMMLTMLIFGGRREGGH
ncbi:MAG: hypothetical protein LBU86_05535 [Oscillospiraceae bacterium]|jgi:sporulation integral membrane protein YlbJ|nr:hypothetical protein [Oscillospiraceae bacterium]